jgi:hypothetical protein
MNSFEISIAFNKRKIENPIEKKFIKIFNIAETYYKKVGLKGSLLDYQVSHNTLDTEDHLYLIIDYIARVCWAFHSQNQIEFLKVYKESFFDYKILKISKDFAIDKLHTYEQNNKNKACGLIDLFYYISETKELNKNFNPAYWCDGLKIEKHDSVKYRISIKYLIDQNRINRSLLNPIKFSFFNPLKYLEHIESLNLILVLGLGNVSNNPELTKHFLEKIDHAWTYFIENPSKLVTPQISNKAVYDLININ